MIQNLFNDCWVFDTGNNLDGTATMLTGFNVDIEYSLQSLRPSHGGLSLFRWPRFSFRGWFSLTALEHQEIHLKAKLILKLATSAAVRSK